MTDAPKARLGRPPRGKAAATSWLQVRASVAEIERWRATAAASGLSVSALARQLLDRAAARLDR